MSGKKFFRYFCSYPNLLLISSLIVVFLLCCKAEDSPLSTVPRWGVAEFELSYQEPLENPFVEVQAEAVFTAPEGKEMIRVEGFYDGDTMWRFRFVPRVQGIWKADLALKRNGREVASAREWFDCKGEKGRGFLEQSALNPYRLQYEDGTPFYSVGIQPCGHAGAGLDGPLRGQGDWRTVDMDTYLQAFHGAANLFRIQLGTGTRAGCAREIMTDELGLYRYNLDACRLLDETFTLLGKYGFATILIPFQDMSLWHTDSTVFGTNKDVQGWKNIRNTEAVEPVRHYLRYLIARYAAYTDIWELFNEDVYTPDDWLAEIASFVKSLDPYSHLITTNYERPLAAWNDIVTAHAYMGTPAWEVDGYLAKEFARLKSFNKPVMYTEFGNQGTLSNRDPVKWRIAVWTAFINESSMLFWSMGGILLPEAPEGRGGNANAYLGPEAREYFRHFLNFVRDLPLDLRPAMIGYSDARDRLRRYALSNGKLAVIYLQQYGGHERPTSGGVYVMTGPGEFEIRWYDPSTGKIVKTERAETDSYTLIFPSPEITTDMAAIIRRIE